MASPTDIILSNDTVLEGVPTGTVVGTFTIVDPDPLGDNSLFLLDDANGAFVLDGFDLVVSDENLIDFDLNPTLNITVIAGRCTADSFIKDFTINVLDDPSLAPIIYTVTPVASKGHQLICVTGRFFTDGGSTTLFINGEEYPIVDTEEHPLTDTSLCFNLIDSSLVGPAIPDCEDKDPFGCGIFEFTICNGNVDINDEPLCDSDIFIRYKQDQVPSLAKGNTQCIIKPIVGIYQDPDSPVGGFNSAAINWTPNSNTIFVQVRAKYDFRFDTTTGGETTLDGRTIIDGDLVWLTNQGDELENGIWIARSGAWEYDMPVDENVFVDLGAAGFDPEIGDISRDIITVVDPNGTLPDSKKMIVDWGTVGIYKIKYYYLSGNCVLSTTTKRVRVFKQNASISPVNTFAITDYKIFNGVDQDLIDNIIPGGSYDVCCPGFVVPESGLYIRKDGSVVFMADQSMGGNKLTNLAYALNDGDAVPFQQLLQAVGLIPKIAAVFTAGENIGTNMVVRLGLDGNVYLASASDVTQVNTIIGISSSDSLTGQDVVVTIKGTIGNFETLVQGREYWLAENGAMSLTAPLTGFNQVIGIASSCETFIVNPKLPLVL